MTFATLAVLALLQQPVPLPQSDFSHGGRKDAEGCHIEKATGKRHCH